jgi:hypothetical protein
MSAKSKAQFRFMKAVESGSLKVPGLSSEEAKEYTKSNVGKKRFKKLKEKLGCKECSGE